MPFRILIIVSGDNELDGNSLLSFIACGSWSSVDIVRLSAINEIFIPTREIRGQGQLIRIESATKMTTKIMNFQNIIKTLTVYSSH